MKLKIQFIDAFADSIFTGNPAAVLITDNWLTDELMQLIATENNLSETAFAVKYDKNSYEIRWFSPITEVAFCGHATLATAYVLFKQNSAVETLTFSTKTVGQLSVKNMGDDFIQMSFPNRKPERVHNVPDDLINGLSIQPQEIYLNQQAYFAIYANEEEVNNVTHDDEQFKKLAPYDVVITAASKNYDFISRYFWPANGGSEDPVTGSIHAGLAPFWSEKLGKTHLSAYQASKRGGKLTCDIEGDRVLVTGKAVQYLEGFINLDPAEGENIFI